MDERRRLPTPVLEAHVTAAARYRRERSLLVCYFPRGYGSHNKAQNMTPELEVLDQLLTGSLPLNVIAGLFPDHDHCRRAVAAMMKSGEVCVLDSMGQPLSEWRYRELEDAPEMWRDGTSYRLAITDAGAKRIG